MALISGTRLGPYEILAPIGAGGMGEVYKVKDTRLDRTVAIKVLPEHLAESPERKQRFEREAKAISQLNHPHICTLYDVGEQDGLDYLVMEYLEGETLAERLKKGPLPLVKVLEYAIQIADALDKAHRAGIVHRDLKPANIIITKSGIKLLDFGLARLIVDDVVSDGSDAPTKQQALTKDHAIVGTLHYMAPEQAEGKHSDRRADIWALGCVLFEMTTGRRAFEGESQASVIAAILDKTPADVGELRPDAPAAFDRAVKTCLEKDPDARFQSAHDVKLQLSWLGNETAVAREKTRPRFRELAAWSVAITALAVSAWVFLGTSRLPSSVEPVRFSFHPAGFYRSENYIFGSEYETVAVSPDGSRMAFIAADDDGTPLVWIRPFTDPEATPLAGTDGARFIFWSPEGDRVGFGARRGLFAIPAAGGPVQRMVSEGVLQASGGSWSRSGVVLVGSADGLLRVDPGSEPTRVGEREWAFWPAFLPDGEHFLYLGTIQEDATSSVENLAIFASSLEQPSERQLVLRLSSRAIFADGYLLFIRDGLLTAQPFDLDELALTGEASVLADGLVYFQSHGGSAFSAAAGRLAYVTRRPPSSHRWVSRDGEALGSLAEPALYEDRTSLSPDGTRAVGSVRSSRSGLQDLYLFNLERGTSSRLNSGETWEGSPVWSPDGRHVAFASDPDGPPDIYVIDLESGGPKKLLWAALDVMLHPAAWSPDGREILVNNGGDPSENIWSLPATGGEDPTPLSPPITTVGGVNEMSFSPDGRWLAVASSESGASEIYVHPFRRPGPRVRLSQEGGRRPRWRRDGRELFFWSGQSVVAVPIEPGENFVSGPPTTLFTLDAPFTFLDTTDGERFLVLMEPTRDSWQPIQVMISWKEFLPRAGNGSCWLLLIMRTRVRRLC